MAMVALESYQNYQKDSLRISFDRFEGSLGGRGDVNVFMVDCTVQWHSVQFTGELL